MTEPVRQPPEYKPDREELLRELDRIVTALKSAGAPHWLVVDNVMNALNRPLL